MKNKTSIILGISLVIMGCIIFGGAMSMLKWDFRKLSTTQYETNEYEITDQYENILLTTDTADIKFLPSENNITTVVCYEKQNEKHTVNVKDNALIIELVDSRKWYEHIGINFDNSEITVYIPQKDYDKISVKSSTGNVKIDNGFNFKSVDISVSTGDIIISSLNCKKDINITVSTGKIELYDITCENVITDGSTGKVLLNNVIAQNKISVVRSTGKVNFDKCDATEIFVTTSTGDVKGSLLTEKVFIAKTSTGKIDTPKTTAGGKCEIETSTGNIKIEIIK